ncbi:MAG TPA: hypothetical protein VNH83_21815 [Bryobacteraceae bacterium]|nr:hypothetical protein [Bryobacteraceae bacterium]
MTYGTSFSALSQGPYVLNSRKVISGSPSTRCSVSNSIQSAAFEARMDSVRHGGEIEFTEDPLHRRGISQIDPDIVPAFRAARGMEDADRVNTQPRQAAQQGPSIKPKPPVTSTGFILPSRRTPGLERCHPLFTTRWLRAP